MVLLRLDHLDGTVDDLPTSDVWCETKILEAINVKDEVSSDGVTTHINGDVLTLGYVQFIISDNVLL